MQEYDDNYPTCVTTFATLRFYHRDASPEVVTQRLGIQPSKSQVKGENIVKDRKVRRPLSGWFLCSEQEVKSRDVRRHIDWVLGQIRGMEDKIEDLRREGWCANINCFWLGIGHGGPMLDPTQMSALAQFGLSCGFDVYADDDRVQEG